uniref:DUF5641 domain-containing protein n=1 Tax=Trichobilharzia regenti TaxID=157069 RepID=A0AA85J103_TRIRE|nr:unnamed protein product [Trichobilharzia regenti]
MMRAMTNRGIEWKLNPPYASHRGGVWERLIRSVRRVLSAVSKEQVLTDESLMTYLTEVERILNSRPLVPVYDDSSQLDVLTPNHILLSRNPEQVPEIDVSLCGRYSRRWKQGQLLADTFWRRWKREYLTTLQSRAKWVQRHRNLQVGDLVLVTAEPSPRNRWSMGIITGVTASCDGYIRKVDIKTPRGIVNRDVRKVCLLEGIEER